MFFLMISSELLKLWYIYIEIWYADHIMNWSIMQKDCFSVFNLKPEVTIRAHIIKMWPTANPFVAVLSLLAGEGFEKSGFLCLKSRPEWKFKTLLNVCQSYIFCATDLSATKQAVLIYWCWWPDQMQAKWAGILKLINTVTYSISTHNGDGVVGWRYFLALGNKSCLFMD